MPSPEGPLDCVAVTVITFVPDVLQLTDTRFPLVWAVWGLAPLPKFQSYPVMVDVLPETVAVTMIVSLTVGLLFEGVTMTDGGCAGSTVTVVLTGSLNPLESVAVAVTV